VLNDPARGIDIGAKRDLYRNLRTFSDRGNAVVFLSSEIEEFVDLCDRVLVFRGGTVFCAFAPPLSVHAILNATFGRQSDARLSEVASSQHLSASHWQPRFDAGRPVPRPVRLKPVMARRLCMNQSGFLLLAPDIAQGGVIPDRFAEQHKCSPALEWESIPQDAKFRAFDHRS